MDTLEITGATSQDLDLLVTMMTEFYGEAAYPLDAARARAAFYDLLQTPALGRVFVVGSGGAPAGYLVLTLTFSMEYGGAAAFIDDFYMRPGFRGRGLGSAALAGVIERARSMNVRAVHLEVGRDNTVAQAVYRRAGFRDNDRQLLTLQLAAAAHERLDAP